MDAATLLLALAELPGLTLGDGDGGDDGSSEPDGEAERLADCVGDVDADKDADAVPLALWLTLNDTDALRKPGKTTQRKNKGDEFLGQNSQSLR